MGDLRLKAQSILKLKQQEKDIESHKKDLSLENMINERKIKSKEYFTEKIKKEIHEFQFNLLESANRGEPLIIDILEIENDIFSKKENGNIKSLIKYLPIKQKVATFLNETNFEFVTDSIITDDNLQRLYSDICENGIYPIWKTRESNSGMGITILYLEVNPLISFDEKSAELKENLEHRRKLENHAVILYTKNLNKTRQTENRIKMKDFTLNFISTLYISVVILTIISSVLGLFPIEEITDTFSVIALGWPYFIFTGFKNFFIVSLPLGLIFALFIAFKKY
jgi:hypothetical protein